MKRLLNAWRVHRARRDQLPPLDRDRYDMDMRELAACLALFLVVFLFSVIVMPTLDAQAEARMAQEHRGTTTYAAK